MPDISQRIRRVATFASLTAVTLAFSGALAAQQPSLDQHHLNPRVPSPRGSAGPSGRSLQSLPQVAPTPSLNPTTWTNIGPAPITADPTAESTPDTGRVTGITAHPTDANTIYVAASGGGVWKTTNGGTSWTALTDNQKTLSMGSIAIAPSNTNVLYAGTGQADGEGNSNFGRGVMVSTDGGATWTLRTNGGVFDRHEITEIAIDPQNSSVAWAAVSSCCATNTLFDFNNGIFKTTDGGVTWTNTTGSLRTLGAFASFTSVRIDPGTTGSSATLYAAASTPFGDADNGVYKSTDGGATWTKLTDTKLPSGTASGRIVVAVSKSNSQVVYVSASGNGNTGSTPNGSLYKFLRSDDGGTTFTDLTAGTPNYMHSQGAFDTSLIVDPSNSAIVYAGGDSNPNGIIRSIDSGAHWTDIAGIINGANGPHVDHHASAFDANGKFLDGDDGGIFRYDPAATPSPTWTSLNGNLSTVQIYSIGIHPTDINTALAGSQDNGLVRYAGDLSWSEVTCGDAGVTRFSPTLGSRAYVACNGTTFFLRSDDTGATWAAKTTGITDTGGNLNFFAPFAVDPNDGNRVVIGERHAWETTDAGETWAQLGTGDPFGANIDAIDLAADDPKVIYVSAGGNVFLTKDKGASWTMINLPVPGKVNALRVFPKDHKKAVAVISEFTTGGNIFHTTDSGKTWTNISGNLPNVPVWSVQFHGDSLSTIYAGTDAGVYQTTDKGGTWNPFGSGFPNAQVFDLQLDTKTLGILAAATFGRGAWEIKLPPPTTINVGKQKGKAGATISLTANVNPNGIPGTVNFTVNGVAVPGTATYDVANGKASQDYTITLAAGTYPITAEFISSDNTKGGNSGDVGELTVK
jgi:photosystem II stability/assembly factor-like uncharacterized protein